MDDKTPPAAGKPVQLRVDHLVPGMELARDVVSDNGKILVGSGTILSRHAINQLKNWQIPDVMIVSEVTVNPITDPKVQQFVNSYNKSVTVVQRAFDDLRATQDLPLEAFTATAEDLAQTAMAAGNVVDRLYDLPPCDDATFQHSVNVSVIAALIATWLGYPPPVVNAVSLTGLLHDIGKSRLSVAILNRVDRLPADQYAEYQKHAAYGFELVRGRADLGNSIKVGVFQHHERTDGGGYPHGLTADRIHPYAKIVAVADLYDEALTVNRDPDILYSPYTALEGLADQKFRLDAHICLTFVSRMMNFLSGNTVVLSDKRQGRVVFLHPDAPSRSMVQLADGTVLDLAEQSGLYIHHVLR